MMNTAVMRSVLIPNGKLTVAFKSRNARYVSSKLFVLDDIYSSKSKCCQQQKTVETSTKLNNLPRCRSYSTTTALSELSTSSSSQSSHNSSSNNNSNNIIRVGLGSQKWSTISKSIYQEIVYESIKNGITTIEAGQEDGDELLASVLRPYLEQKRIQQEQQVDESAITPLQILVRIGYRAINNNNNKVTDSFVSSSTSSSGSSRKELFPQDVQLTQQELISSSSLSNENSLSNDTNNNIILHNIHPSYIEHVINNSACVQLYNDYPHYVQIVIVLHNPEEQQNGTDDVVRLKSRLCASFIKLQELVVQQKITSFGICSNGICLPNNHPLHLSWYNTIVPALHEATTIATTTTTDSAATDSSSTSINFGFTVLQFPCNVMESSSLSDFVKDIKLKQLQAKKNSTTSIQDQQEQLLSLYKNIQLYGIRPLSCYPDRGTGNGNPFLLIDYQVPGTMNKVLNWTNELLSIPELYNIAYTTAIQHFDASDILDKQAQGLLSKDNTTNNTNILSVEEQETLDGCKLLQSLLNDLNNALSTVRSVQQYENDLLIKIIPLIQNTFDSYDDDTAAVLQSYFGAYNIAVKYSVATNIRQLVHAQGESNMSITNNIISSSSLSSSITDLEQLKQEVNKLLIPSKRLQEFAIEYVLNKKLDSIQQQQSTNTTDSNSTTTMTYLVDKVIVGCTEPWHVQDIVNISKKVK